MAVHSPPPGLSLRGLGLALLIWALYGLVNASILTLEGVVSLRGALAGQAISATILAALSVPAWWGAIRGLHTSTWRRRLVYHLVVGPVYAAAALGLYVAVSRWVWGPETAGALVDSAGWIGFGYGLVYVVQFAIYHTAAEVLRARRATQIAEAMQTLAQESELSALRSKIHPHFLLNALHAVSAKITADPAGARDMVSDLGDLLRYTLRSSDLPDATLAEEIRFAEAYLCLQAERFSDRMNVTVRLHSGVLDTRVPPVVLQPLVDNAVKHGVQPSRRPTTVTVEVTREADGLADGAVRVIVRDDGDGTGPSPPSLGVGLTNTDARLQMFFGPDASLHAGPLPGGGFAAWFDIPASAVVAKPALRVLHAA